jgi:hypothetical protein
MYHVEIRQFPHNACRLNLTDAELVAVVIPWVREQAVDFGERKWSPHTARLTILEGEAVAHDKMTMGRGWRIAQRNSEDVTERLLASAREAEGAAVAARTSGAAAASAGAGGVGGGGGSQALSDPLAVGVQIAALLGPDPARLLEAWRAAAAASPDLAPSEALAAAERALDPPA